MASERSTSSRRSHNTSVSDGTADKARVFVNLPDGTKLFVPVAQDATIHDLHQATLRRAAKFGFQCGLDESYLQTTGQSPVAMDSEDNLIDVLDLTEDSMFSLCLLGGKPWTLFSNSKPGDSSSSNPSLASLLFIRWTTLEEALSQSRISAIKPDRAGIPAETPLTKIYDLALERLRVTANLTTASTITLYLHDCKLAAKDNPASLRDLGLSGTSTAPLDIFIDVDSSKGTPNLATFNDASTPSELWGFPTTKRGICTLTTALSILSTEIKSKTLSLEDCQDVLFEVTHFPPLLLALRTIHELGVESIDAASSLRMLASAFQILCLQMAPRWVCMENETALESARQAVAWLFTLESKVEAVGRPVVKKVKIMQHEAQGVPELPSVHHIQVDDSAGSQEKNVVVALDESDMITAERVRKCLHTDFSDLWDLYLKYEDWGKMLLHKKVMTPQPTDFDFILKTTDLAGRFKMVGPLQLGSLLAAQLPVITLSGEGYVSTYDQEDFECSERRFYLWNAVQKKEVMKHTNPGQLLMQKLESVIAARKKEKCWVVNSWSNLTQTADFGRPEEAIVVCMDASASMGTSMPVGWLPQSTGGDRPSRLTEVKEFFKNFALRVSALRLPTYLGLVTFSSNTMIDVKQTLTPVHLNFEERVEGINPLSQTAIFNGLSKARQMLTALKTEHPEVQCRIIVLTDGQDNNSTLLPSSLGLFLAGSDIILDSVVIDTPRTADLFKISRMTGGYAFAPKTQQELFQIFLLETIVDLRTRPDIVKVPLQSSWDDFVPKASDMPDPYTFPPCRPHPNQNDYFIALADADKYISRSARSAESRTGPASVRSLSRRSTATTATSGDMTGTTLSTGGGAGGHARIILSEIKEMIKHPHDFMDVYVSESNMGFWKIAMQGPPGSAYAAGVFLLYLDLGAEFPLRAPAARFVTPVLHPNVTKHGRICHPIFHREWNGTTRVYQVLQHVWGILMSLEARDAVDPLSTLQFWTNPTQGRMEVEKYVARFASRSRAALREEITGGGSDTSSVASSQSSSLWDNASVSSGGDSDAKTITGSNGDAKTATGNKVTRPSSLSTPGNYARRAATAAPGGASSYSSYVASQRGGPPPFMSVLGQTGNSTSRPVSAKDVSKSLRGDEQGRRLSRRASFFKIFKKPADEGGK